MGASLSNTEHTDFTTTLPHSPSDNDVVGSHQDFIVRQNIVQSALECMHAWLHWTVDLLQQFALIIDA